MKTQFIVVGVLLVLIAGGIFVGTRHPASAPTAPTPTLAPSQVAQLPPNQAPAASLTFSSDGHYVTVNITKIHAAKLEYNIVYDATVKNNQINTGVSGSSSLGGNDTYSYKQLLGSESSGHFTYHTNIQNATMELTLRNDAGYSIYTATYPFTVTPGKTVSLTPQQ